MHHKETGMHANSRRAHSSPFLKPAARLLKAFHHSDLMITGFFLLFSGCLYNRYRKEQGDALCKECFFLCFETEIHETVVRGGLFRPGMKVAIGASGGKGA